MWKKYNGNIYNLMGTNGNWIQVIYEYFLYDLNYREIIVEEIENKLNLKLNQAAIDVSMDHSGLKLL